MARPKKELIPTAPLSRASALIERLQQTNPSVCSASQVMTRWRYIDFVNPLAKLPCISLEWLFGARGLLAGRIMQLRATYSKGKSSFMYLVYAMAQMMSDAYCFHVETEGAAAPGDFIASFGCNPDQLVIDEIASLEECLGRIDEVIAQIRGGRGGEVDPETGKQRKTKYTDPLDAAMAAPIVAGIDSLSSLGLEEQVNQDIADMTKTPASAQHARKLRDYLRRRVSLFRDAQALIMLTAHETAKIEHGKKAFGGPKKSSMADEAIGIHATYALDVDSQTWADREAGVTHGSRISLYTTKNKLSPRYRRLELFMRTNHGFDLIETDYEFLKSHAASPMNGKITIRGGNCKDPGIVCADLSDKAFKSKEEFLRAFYNNTDLVMSLREQMRIRGCGFAFETQYQNKLDEAEAAGIEHVTDEPAAEAATPAGDTDGEA